ncbi:MAG: D-aminoacylase [Deltaproteobacteria bacterium]|nr:D-aminoacylase [Deltaproteobacteria bacterium]
MKEYNLLLTNGKIIDGTGNPWYKADIGIREEKIEAIGNLKNKNAERYIDAEKLVISPGFIDIHTHSDLSPFHTPEADSHIYQGITTDVIGNCGISPAPISDYLKEQHKLLAAEYDINFDWSTFGEYLDKLDSLKTSINLVPLVGQAAIRMAVMGMDNRSPTSEEMEQMKKHVAEAMEAGAFGISTGLWYAPSGFAKTDEIIELAKVASTYGRIYASHIRGEGDPLIKAVKEAIDIGDKAKLPVQISHHKAMGMRNWGKVHDTLRMMEEARERGVEVTADVYAWTANATGLTAMLPHWVHEGGKDQIIERLKDDDTRNRIKKDMTEGLPGWESLVSECGWDRIMVTRSPIHENYEGKRIQELADEKGVDPYDFAFDLLIEEDCEVSLVIFSIKEEDAMYVMKHPLAMIASDSSAICPRGYIGRGKPHPRGYGNAVRFLGTYVREKKLMDLEQGIRKMTSFPAQKVSLKDRGLIKEGMVADLVIFNPKTIASNATYNNPHQYPTGVHYVLVNGELVIEKGKHTNKYPGKILRKN